jgi:hypothetical protein
LTWIRLMTSTFPSSSTAPVASATRNPSPAGI